MLGDFESDQQPSFLRNSRALNSNVQFCSNQGESLRLAIRCNDGTELLVCAGPEAVTGNNPNYCSNPKQSWTKTQCQNHGGFDTILPYYSGCYKETKDFWESYAPGSLVDGNLNRHGNGGGNTCHYDIPVPPLNSGVKNLNFEDQGMGLSGWDVNEIHTVGRYVRTRCDSSRCSGRTCRAFEGSCYAYISAGESELGKTEPNSITRDDFRLPEFDETCLGQLNDIGVSTDYCLIYARRFYGVDLDYDDFMKIEFATVNDASTVLYEDTMSEFGDSGWEVVEVPLPTTTRIGSKTFARLSISVINDFDNGNDSVVLIDDIKIAPCTTK